jgi:glycosyltransferase involved in cell wall biosynthesis
LASSDIRHPVDVSVVIPTLDRPELLRPTLTSLHAQDCRECEFLIIDDGSDQETRDVIANYLQRDQRFRMVEKSPGLPRGPQSSRNLGMSHAEGQYLMFLDSDDLLSPGCLKQRRLMASAEPNVDIHVFPQAVFSSEVKALKLVNVPSNAQELDRFICFAWPLDVPWVNGAALFKTRALRDSGVSWLEQFHWDDLVFHFSCVLSGMSVRWCFDQSPDCYYRIDNPDSHGEKLHSREGLSNTAVMAQWMRMKLERAGELTAQRRKVLAINFFHAVLLPAIDRRLVDFKPLERKSLIASDLLRLDEGIRIAWYALMRAVLSGMPRATYYWNRFCRRIWLKDFFPSCSSTYASVSVPEPEWSRLRGI